MRRKWRRNKEPYDRTREKHIRYNHKETIMFTYHSSFPQVELLSVTVTPRSHDHPPQHSHPIPSSPLTHFYCDVTNNEDHVHFRRLVPLGWTIVEPVESHIDLVQLQAAQVAMVKKRGKSVMNVLIYCVTEAWRPPAITGCRLGVGITDLLAIVLPPSTVHPPVVQLT